MKLKISHLFTCLTFLKLSSVITCHPDQEESEVKCRFDQIDFSNIFYNDSLNLRKFSSNYSNLIVDFAVPNFDTTNFSNILISAFNPDLGVTVSLGKYANSTWSKGLLEQQCSYKVFYLNGDVCNATSNLKWNTIVHFVCDQSFSAEEPKIIIHETEHLCQYNIHVYIKEMCPTPGYQLPLPRQEWKIPDAVQQQPHLRMKQMVVSQTIDWNGVTSILPVSSIQSGYAAISGDGLKAVFAGSNDYIYYTVNSTNVWMKSNVIRDYYKQIICSYTCQYVVAVVLTYDDSSPKSLQLSSDFGVTFLPLTVLTSFYSATISSTGEYVFGLAYVMNQGVLLLHKWSNYGAIYDGVTDIPFCTHFIIEMSYNDRMTCYGDGRIFTSIDYGVSFQQSYTTLPTTSDYNGLRFNQYETLGVVIATTLKQIYFTSNNGTTWNLSNNLPFIEYVSIASNYNTGQYVVVATNSDFLYLSTDYGVSFSSMSVFSGSDVVKWSNIVCDMFGIQWLLTHDSDNLSGVQPLYRGILVDVNTHTPTVFPTVSQSPTIISTVLPTVSLVLGWTNTRVIQSWSGLASSDSGQYVYASSGNGTWRSFDYANTWHRTPDIIGTSITDVRCSGTGQYVSIIMLSLVMFSSGKQAFSDDFGVTWRIISDLSNTNPYGFAFSTSGQFMYAADYTLATMYYSNSYGQTWSGRVNGAGWRIACSSSGQYVMMTTNTSCIQVSSNYGVSFTTVMITCTEDWNEDIIDLLVISGDGKWQHAVNRLGVQFRSSDFGVSFSIVGPTKVLTRWCISTTGLLAATVYNEGNFIVYSDDHGETWYDSTSPSGLWGYVAIDSTRTHIVATSPDIPIYNNYPLTPSTIPTLYPSMSAMPSWNPSRAPSQPTGQPSVQPSSCPSLQPSSRPSKQPVLFPTSRPSCQPSTHPTSPTSQPSSSPTRQPISCPSMMPSCQPSSQPTQPTSQPSSMPSMHPSSQPSCQPSGLPSAMPTSAPSCGVGSSGDAGGCDPCPAGTYGILSEDHVAVCVHCPARTHSPFSGAETCKECPYPWTTVTDGQSLCLSINLDREFSKSVAILASLLFIVLLCIVSGRNRIPMFLNLVYPTLDVFSDLAYMMTNDFYNFEIFICVVLCLVFPVPLFIVTLREAGAMPALWWKYEVSDAQADMFDMMHMSVTSRKIIWCVLLVPNILFLVIWMFVGMFFHLTKVITLGIVWNLWFRVWTGTNDHDTDVDIDTEELNKCLQQEFYFETVPQFVIQLVNNAYLRALSPMAIVSMTQSVYTALNGCYKFVYYRYCLGDSARELKDIPIDKSIAIKIAWLGIDYTFINAKLEPKAKKKVNRKINTRAVIPQNDVEQQADGVEFKTLTPKFIVSVEVEDVNKLNEEYLKLTELQNATFTEWLTLELSTDGVSMESCRQCAHAFIRIGINTRLKWIELIHFKTEHLLEMGIKARGLQKHILHLHRKLLRLSSGTGRISVVV